MKNLFRILALVLTGLLWLPAPAAWSVENPVPADQRQFKGFEPSSVFPSEIIKTKQILTYGVYGGGDVDPGTSYIANSSSRLMCTALDSNCAKKDGQNIELKGFATFCDLQDNIICIEKLELSKNGTDWETANFLNYWDSTPRQEDIEWLKSNSDANLGMPTVSSVAKVKTWRQNKSWSAPGSAPGPASFESSTALNEAGTGKYLVDASFRFQANNFRNGRPTNTMYEMFHVNVRPFVELAETGGRASIEYFGTNKTTGEKGHSGSGQSAGFGTWQVNGRIGYSAGFSDGTQVRLTMRIPSALGGWFHTRVSAPSLDLEPINKSQNLIVIEGGATEVPISAGWVERFSAKGLKYKDWFSQRFEFTKSQEAKGLGGVEGTSWTPGQSLSHFQRFAPLLGNQALGKASIWYLEIMPPERLGNNYCLNRTNKVHGLINTDAMVYQADIPKFANGFLNYEVAGLHRDMDGQVTRGRYDLIIRSDTARCLYGFSNAPLSASVSVTNEKGSKAYATTTVGEKNGWLKLSAYNFTFSKKTIKVKIRKK